MSQLTGESLSRAVLLDEYWQTVRRHFDDDPSQAKILGLEAILRFIEEDFRYNRLRNKELRSILKQQLEAANKIVKANFINEEFSTLISQIIRQIEDGDSLRLRGSIGDALLLCNEGLYVDGILNRLSAYVQESATWPFDSIKVLLDELFSAFLFREYTRTEIGAVIRAAFLESSQERSDGTYVTDFIDIPLDAKTYLNGYPPNIRAWGVAQKQYIDALTVDERFAAIKRYYLRARRPYRFIAQVQGRRVEIDFEIGPVTLYPPRPRFIVSQIPWELFHREVDAVHDRVNVSIILEARSPHYGMEAALDEFQVLTDAMNLYWPARVPARVIRNHTLAADLDGELRSSSSSADEESDQWYGHMTLDITEHSAHSTMPSVCTAMARSARPATPTDTRFRTAMSAFGRAATSSRHQAILNYWIVVDSLCSLPGIPEIIKGDAAETTESLANAFFPAAFALQETSNVGWNLYNDLQHAVSNRHEQHFAAALGKIPDDLIVRSGLRPKPFGFINLADLVARLPDWETSLAPSFLQEKVSLARRFYGDRAEAKKVILALHCRVKAEIAVFYQLRNRVVHHADETSGIVNVFVDRARTFAQLLLAYANGPDVEDIREAIALTINGWERLNSKLLDDNSSLDLLKFDALIRRSVRRSSGEVA